VSGIVRYSYIYIFSIEERNTGGSSQVPFKGLVTPIHVFSLWELVWELIKQGSSRRSNKKAALRTAARCLFRYRVSKVYAPRWDSAPRVAPGSVDRLPTSMCSIRSHLVILPAQCGNFNAQQHRSIFGKFILRPDRSSVGH